jgi:hypothetical protein
LENRDDKVVDLDHLVVEEELNEVQPTFWSMRSLTRFRPLRKTCRSSTSSICSRRKDSKTAPEIIESLLDSLG